MEIGKKRSWAEYAVYGIIILAVAVAVFSSVFSSADFNFNNFFTKFNAPFSFSKTAPASKLSEKQYDAITTGTTGEGDVEISLEPSLQGELLVVAASFNTHSVDLSQYDLRQLVSLESGKGGEAVAPLKVFSLSGHHSSGQITFKTGALADTFAITINGIPALPERKYAW